MKMEEEEEDRISDLPDSLLHHILSLLPSTKEAIRTGILSKRWKNQWTRVPVLIFHFVYSGMSSEKFLQFIDNTLILHDCSKINKFHLNLSLFLFNGDLDITPIIGFATSKNVEDFDLILRGFYLLPEFIFNNASLVKLRTLGCSFMIPNGKVNWGCFKVLKIQHCKLTDEALEHVLSGSPLLESFELDNCSNFDTIVIASKFLKRLVLLHVGMPSISVLEISCPGLKELSIDSMNTNDPKLFARAIERVLSGSSLLKSMSIKSISCGRMLDQLVIASESLKSLVLGDITSDSGIEISCPNLKELSLDSMTTNNPKLFAQAIESVLSGSLLLESMSIKSISCGRMIDQLVIASKSLKRLALGNITSDFDIEISCPKLEGLKMFECLNVNTAKLLNLPSALCAVINFNCLGELKTHKSLIEDILHQLQHVLGLIFGTWFIKILSTIKVGGGFSPMLNVKCLALDSPHLKRHHLGIANLLRISPMLEELIISVPAFYRKVNLNHKIENNYWISNATVFECLVSHLKTIKIICFGLPEGDVIRQHMLNLVQFILKNARVLEKMVVIVKDDGTGYPLEVSQELLKLPRCSQNVITELLRK